MRFMRSKKVVANALVQVVLELVTILSGFIVPSLIIENYGSGTNGLIVSITQFLGYLTLLQTGIGGVSKAAFYKPLAEKDVSTISAATNALKKFFRGIGYISIVYLLALMVLFPVLIEKNQPPMETVALVFIIWLGTFAQYCFGQTYQYLLQADQRDYIFSISQIVVVILNTVISVVMINSGFSIIMVKLVSASVFVLRPIVLAAYCQRKYSLNSKQPANMDIIKQRWDGFGHTIAYFVHSKIPVFLLTTVGALTEVSIYNVYHSIAYGISMVLSTIANAVQAAFGNMIARGENKNLKNNFYKYTWLNRLTVAILFTTGIVTVIPFMQVYAKDFPDSSQYIRLLFSMLIMVAEALYCVRMPYKTIAQAAGKYKETKIGAFIEVGVNVVVSLSLVWKFGMIGVAIGTIAAMLYRTVDYMIFMVRNIFRSGMKRNVIYIAVDSVLLIVACIVSLIMNRHGLFVSIDNYFSWFVLACVVIVVVTAVYLPVWILTERRTFFGVVDTVKRMLPAKHKK